MENLNSHHDYMQYAIQLAERGRYTVSPNPMVGCVIVKNGKIIGEGWHQRAGEPHAEINALRNTHESTQDAIMYVSLEPCCHHGRTPPCTDAIIAAKIKKVYIACLDPNPLVAGKGVAQLRAAGIEVESGLAESQAKQQNEIFFHYITTKQPFVISKWAMSLDGKTITHPKDSRQISGSESQHHTHRTRAQVDAILIGANTAVQDNPLLTVRFESSGHPSTESIARQPIRIILSTDGNLPLDLKMFDKNTPGKTIVATTETISPETLRALQERTVEVLMLSQDENKQVDLHHLLKELGKKEITSLLVEGGMKVHESFFAKNLVNKVNVYIASVIIGGLVENQKLPEWQVESIGADFYVSGGLF